MARILASDAGAGAAASAALGSSSWLLGLCMVVVSVWVVSFAVFICGRSPHSDDCPAKKQPAAKANPSSRGGTARSSRTVADTSSMYTAAYMGGASAAACGCSAGHGGGGCGGGGGGGGGCGGGGGGGC